VLLLMMEAASVRFGLSVLLVLRMTSN
jgi:hypothetical protein